MYQTLISLGVLGDDPRGLRPPLDAEDLQRLSNALVDGVWGDSQLCRDLLRAEVLVDQAQAFELPARQARDARGDVLIRRLA